MAQHPKPRPRDDRDTVQDIARDLAEIASHLGQLKGDANVYLSDPNYDTLKLRLEVAHSAVEAAAVEASELSERLEELTKDTPSWYAGTRARVKARVALEQAEELGRVLEVLGESLGE